MQDNPKSETGQGSASRGPRQCVICFGPFTLDLKSRELRRNGRRLRLAEKPFLVLAALLEHPGDLVLRDELRQRLWADDTFVDFDNNLNTAVASLREVLCDSARTPKFIETLPRLGYRFIGSLRPLTDSFPAPNPATAPATVTLPAQWHLPHLPARHVWAAGIAGVALAVIALWLGLGEAVRFASRDAASEFVSPGSSAYADGVYLLQRDDHKALPRAAALLERAVQEQPRHAQAQAALAEVWLRMTLRGLVPGEAGFAKAEPAALRAVDLDGALAAPHRSLAMIRLHRDWDFAAAQQESARALEADPADAQSHLVVAVVSAAAGRPGDAVRAARRAIALDPGNQRIRADLAFFLLADGRLEEAAAESRAVLALQPDFAPALDFLLAACERLQRSAEARDAAVKLMEHARAPDAEIRAVRKAPPQNAVRSYRAWQVRYLEANAAKQAWPPMAMASIYASAGEADKAFAWLEQAYLRRDTMLVFLAANPDLAPVRSDPRFASLTRRVGVPGALPAS